MIYKQAGRKLKGLPIKNQLRYFKSRFEVNNYLKQNGIEKEEVLDHVFLDLYNNPNIMDTRFTLTYNIMIRMELAGSCGIYMPPNNLIKGYPQQGKYY